MHMVELSEIKRVSEVAARDALRPMRVEYVEVEPEIGHEGDDLLRVRIIVPDGEVDDLNFDHIFAAMLRIKDDIKRTGEERRALIGFITPTELATRASLES